MGSLVVENDRRRVIRETVNKARNNASKTLSYEGEGRSRYWIRPPYALPEAEFLAACRRCDACIEACPHGVIFRLSGTVGAQAALTPALDLMNHGCHLCADWPCVKSCETGALQRPEEKGQVIAFPLLARAWIDQVICLSYKDESCGVCSEVCPVVAGAESLRLAKPVIDQSICVGCGLCREACVSEPKAIHIRSLAA